MEKRLTNEELNELIEMAKSKNRHTSCSVYNKALGEIVLPHGRVDSDKNIGYGYEHIVYGRCVKDKLLNNEIGALIIKTLEMLKNATKDDIKEATIKNRVLVEKDGRSVILSKERFLGNDIWILSSYPLFKKGTNYIKQEAKASLYTVNAVQEYAQYYSSFCNIVGALTSRLIISKKLENDNTNER